MLATYLFDIAMDLSELIELIRIIICFLERPFVIMLNFVFSFFMKFRAPLIENPIETIENV